jgi:hypothetical protein
MKQEDRPRANRRQDLRDRLFHVPFAVIAVRTGSSVEVPGFATPEENASVGIALL